MNTDTWVIDLPCCDTWHRITIRSNGPLTLHGHKDQTKDALHLYEQTAGEIPCLAFLRDWQKGIEKTGSLDEYIAWHKYGISYQDRCLMEKIYILAKNRRQIHKAMPKPAVVKAGPIALKERSNERLTRGMVQAWGRANYMVRRKTVVSGEVEFNCWISTQAYPQVSKHALNKADWSKERHGRKVKQDLSVTLSVPLRWSRILFNGMECVDGVIVLDHVTPYDRDQWQKATRLRVLALHEVPSPAFGVDPFSIQEAVIGRVSPADPWDALVWVKP